jgi:hypothetical protein
LNVEKLLRHYGRATVYGLARPVENTSEHIFRYGRLQNFARELEFGVSTVDTGGALEHLNDGAVAVNLEDLASSRRAVAELDVDDLRVLGGLRCAFAKSSG